MLVGAARALGVERFLRRYWRNIYGAYRSWLGARRYRRVGRAIADDVYRVSVAGREFAFLTVDDFSKFHFFVRDNAEPGRLREAGLTRELCSLFPTARCFADVGANVGYFACIARGLNPALAVYAFELDAVNIERMRRNIDLNRCAGVEVVHAAVMDRAGEIGYSRPPENRDMPCSTLTVAPPLFERMFEHRERVRAIALDEFFLERGVAPDIVKIDVEGAELEVLRGMERLLREHRPTIFVELHGVALPRFGHSEDDVAAFLRDRDYDLSFIDEHRTGTAGAVAPLPPGASAKGVVLLIARPKTGQTGGPESE